MKRILSAVLIFGVLASFSACRREYVYEAGLPDPKGDLRISMLVPDSLNPLKTNLKQNTYVLSFIYEGLFQIDDSMRANTCLAESYSLSDDAMSMSITLKDVKFHSGQKLCADDVLYSFELAMESSYYKNMLDFVSSYKKTGEKTLLINFNRPFSNAKARLVFPIIPNGKNLERTADGTGLYKLLEYQSRKHLKLVRNEEYHNDLGGGFLSVTAFIVPGTDSKKTLFLAKSIDVIELSAEASVNFTPDENKFSYASNKFLYLGFNYDREVFKDKSVRQAICYAIDLNEIKNNLLNDTIALSYTPINSQSYVYVDAKKDYAQDVKKSAECLLEDGYQDQDFDGIYEKETGGKKDLLDFSILVNEENKNKIELAKMLAKQLNQAGMRVSVESAPFDEFKERLLNKEFDSYIGTASLNSEQDFSPLFMSGGELNFGGYQSDVMEDLLNRTKTFTDTENVLIAYRALNELILEDLPVIGIGFEQNNIFSLKKVKGAFKPSVLNPYADCLKIELD